ncbi:DUF5709 domain-containing protein [Streptomyces sp. NRRL S-920]|uniref:DUF5709 domain-containing protein n=1 Tax=Streptomyces sp. NRRL S-920 TaxID=1463921 RepID=UPI0004C6D415|nr:DUF5709 domain-containing protein [Streptomyces sp. NRRL S-920]
MDNDDVMGDEVYQPDAEEVREDEGILDPEDTLNDRASDPYDEGWSPPERPLGVNHTGTTAEEQREGETLDERLSEEVPDPALEVPAPGEDDDGIGDTTDTDGEPIDEAEVGDARAGRLFAPDEGATEDPEDAAEQDMVGEDMGVDGGAASAEEAAVHIIPAEGEDPADSRGTGG